MKRLLPELLLLLAVFCRYVAARAVFAHFMVGNTEGWTQTNWRKEINLAAASGIDAFALNINAAEATTNLGLKDAFDAADSHGGFKLFISFDYAGLGPWAPGDVKATITQYASRPSYYRYNGKPFVSTFEGPGNAADWVSIKADTGCFFMPDWSSRGAKEALQLANGVADGLFNWAAWSWAAEKPNTYIDASYYEFLRQAGNKPYMAPVSPWFYTNLPGYDKNWLWPVRTMDLWEQRWAQLLAAEKLPDFIQIISWNDYGESHYISGAKSSPPFSTGKAAYDYVSGMDHDGWLNLVSVYAQQYKAGVATVTQELITTAYWKNHVEDCNNGETTINTASQLQFEYSPNDLAGAYYLSYTAVLASDAQVSIMIGNKIRAGNWDKKPLNGVGIYHGSVFIGTDTGAVVVTLKRGSTTLATINGAAIGGCTSGFTNFNPYVGTALAGRVSATTNRASDLVCTAGTGAPGFEVICGITCSYGYCPIGACLCTAQGSQKPYPPATGLKGYSKGDPSYIGLCDWTFNLGFASQVGEWCSSTPKPIVEPNPSPFLPKVCTAGEAGPVTADGINELCAWTCQHGYCPINVCQCTSVGALANLPAYEGGNRDIMARGVLAGNRHVSDTCRFACQFGFCPDKVCLYASVPSPTYDNCYVAPDGSGLFLDPIMVGAVGGTFFCASRYGEGVVVAGIEMWRNAVEIRGVRFKYSDNSYSKIYGHAWGENGEGFIHGNIEWEPGSQLITQFRASRNKWRNGFGGISMQIEGPGDMIYFVFAADGDVDDVDIYPGGGILLGAQGHDGYLIDNLGFQFLIDRYSQVAILDIKWQDDLDQINRERKGIEAVNMDTVTYVNNSTQGPVEWKHKWKYEISYERILGRSWTYNPTVKANFSWMLKTPTLTEFMPGIEIGFSFTYQEYDETRNKMTKSDENELKVKVAAKKGIRCTNLTTRGTYNGKYIATVKYTLANGMNWIFELTDTFYSVAFTRVNANCQDVDLNNLKVVDGHWVSPDGTPVTDVNSPP